MLCELVYRWFSPPAGRVLDPFAGGSVRGIVAATLGRRYTGVDLRPDQVAANQDNAAEIITSNIDGPRPWWVTGDATALDELDVGEADLVFSCPPYADLEVYSTNPHDLSTMDYSSFREAHAHAIQLASDRLRPDSWAVWVIGEARNGAGGFYGLVADTVHAFLDAGMTFATEAVLVTQVGTGSIRAGRMFTGTRALCRSHQNVLVFCKGNRKRAAMKLGDVDLSALADVFESTPDTT